MKIAFATGNQMNIRMIPDELTFEKFAKQCSKPRKGGKHEAYFIRGGDMIESEDYKSSSGKKWGKGHFRKDEFLRAASVLVLDGDSSLDNPNSAPNPKKVHEFLIKRNINHFIYTTHSHNGSDKTKWRCVIEANYKKADLKPAITKLIKELNDEDIWLKNVKENSVWSQPWFLPTRSDPQDSHFQYYCHLSGGSLEVQGDSGGADGECSEAVDERSDVRPAERDSGTGNLEGMGAVSVGAQSRSLGDMLQSLVSGEDMHDPLMTLSFGMVKDGLPKAYVIELMKGIMELSPDEVKHSGRWQDRYKDIGRTVDGAFDRKIQEDTVTEELPELDFTRTMDDIDWPPGAMGELARACYRFSPHPYKLVSIIAALGLVAGVNGRKFNVMNTGLNVYITLLMPTGSGKNVIKDFIHSVLDDIDQLGQGSRFIGAKRYTSPKAILDKLNVNRSCISIQTEAGMLFKSSAGDQAGILRTFLDLYTCSGKYQYSDAESYSSIDNSLPALASPALSLINEATPATFESELDKRDSVESGELARMSLFKFVVEKPKYNTQREVPAKLSAELRGRILKMVNGALEVQSGEDVKEKIVDIDLPSGLFTKFSDECILEENKLMHEDSLRKAMFSRAPLKCAKIAALCAIMDGETSIRVEHWEWARRLFAFELSTIGHLGRTATGDSPVQFAMDVSMEFIYKIVSGKYKDPLKSVNAKLRRANMFTYSSLNQATRKNKSIQAAGYNGRDGLGEVLKAMVKDGLAIKLQPDQVTRYMHSVTSATQVFQLTPQGLKYMARIAAS